MSEKLSPGTVLLMLAGAPFEGVDLHATGDEVTAPAVPSALCPLLLGQNSTACRTEKLRALKIISVHSIIIVYTVKFLSEVSTFRGASKSQRSAWSRITVP